jgi:hypothetical protein
MDRLAGSGSVTSTMFLAFQDTWKIPHIGVRFLVGAVLNFFVTFENFRAAIHGLKEKKNYCY